MTSSNDNEEVAAECPYNGTERSKMLTEIKRTEQDIETKQIDKDIPDELWQT